MAAASAARLHNSSALAASAPAFPITTSPDYHLITSSPDHHFITSSLDHHQRYINAPYVDDLRIAVFVSYLVIFAVGSAGNALVLYVIGRHAEIRVKSVANYYIWNLALADLVFLMTLPLYCYATLTLNWPFGWFTCKLSYAVSLYLR